MILCSNLWILVSVLLLMVIQRIFGVCVSSSSPSPSSLSSASLCFNTTTSTTTEDGRNIFNHRLVDPYETSENSTLVISDENPEELDQAESRQIRIGNTVSVPRSKLYGRKRKKVTGGSISSNHRPSPIMPPYIHHYPRNVNQRKSVFIPVALYSVTKKLPTKSTSTQKMSASNVSLKRKQLNPNSSKYIHRRNNEDSSYADDDDDDDDEDDDEAEVYGRDSSGSASRDYEMRKESAVYGYIQKPEMIEFKGQYYFHDGNGDNGNHHYQQYNHHQQQQHQQQPQSHQPQHHNDYRYRQEGSSFTNRYQRQLHAEYDDEHYPSSYLPHHEHEIHEHHELAYVPPPAPVYDHFDHDPPLSAILLAKLKKILIVKGITLKGILLATLPFLLSPLLSYMLTPVVIPITATVAAGRRRRRRRRRRDLSFSNLNTSTLTLQDFAEDRLHRSMVILDYLAKWKPNDEMATNRSVADFLRDSGFFAPWNRCLEQLVCRYPTSDEVNHPFFLRGKITSIIKNHLLDNQFVPVRFKQRIQVASHYGASRTEDPSTEKLIGPDRQCSWRFPCKQQPS